MASRHYTRPRRRSPIPALLLFLGAAVIVFLIFRLTSTASEQDVPPAPSDPAAMEVSPAPDAADPLPALEEAPWYLTLANADHPLPADWAIETATLTNGLEIDARIYDALTRMLNDCKAAGLSPIVCSAYRTVSRQQELFDAKLEYYLAEGLDDDAAYASASAVVAIPGTSEHNLGLAVDICALDYQLLDDAQAETAEQKWLMEHCTEYGFILRYPQGKEDLTGIIWEPWHYRYVGVEAAKAISESDLCLEEYLALFYSGI